MEKGLQISGVTTVLELSEELIPCGCSVGDLVIRLGSQPHEAMNEQECKSERQPRQQNKMEKQEAIPRQSYLQKGAGSIAHGIACESSQKPRRMRANLQGAGITRAFKLAAFVVDQKMGCWRKKWK